MGKHRRPSRVAVATGTATAGFILAGTAVTAGHAGVVTVPKPPVPLPEHAVTTALVTATPVATPVYQVKAGDTLSAIAGKFCGSAAKWMALWKANASAIKNPNLIYSGQLVKLACAAVASMAGTPAPRATTDAAAPTVTITGAQGVIGSQTLAALASALTAQGYDGTALAATAGYLREHGYSAAGAAGVDGCIAGESGGNPESVGDGGGGLIGWTPLPGGLVTGNPSADLAAQDAALISYDNANGSVAALNAQPSAAAAADYYSAHFERPAVMYSDVRYGVASEVFSALGG